LPVPCTTLCTRPLPGVWVVLVALALLPATLEAQTADNVVVVVNDRSAASRQIADYYVSKRGVPSGNVVRITSPTDDSIERSDYASTIEQPIAREFVRRGLQDRALYIVLTKGVPLRINGTGGATGTVASVDSELALLYRRLVGHAVPVAGRVDNPYFLGSQNVDQARPFSHRDHDIYLVSRLDGFTVQDVIGLIDRAGTAQATGKVVLDQQDKLVNRSGESWLEAAAARLSAAGHADSVVLEQSVEPARRMTGVLGYYSWGSNDPRNRVRRYGMDFVPGALAATFVSTDARTFAEPPPDWVPSGDWDAKTSFFAGSPQSLTGDLIREGATGAAGHVAEPYLQSTIRPEILFPSYLAGFNLVESFYLAMPHLGWQTVVVGDPLTNPFPRVPVNKSVLEDVVDDVTTLPGFFARRRLALAATQLSTESTPVLLQMVRASALLERGDREGAILALQQATTLSESLPSVHLQLALLHEQQGNVRLAAERYQRVVDLQPSNAVALNNLAYLMATRLGRPRDALPLAERALTASRQNPQVLDTVGWIQHLLGDHMAALKTLTAAVTGMPSSAPVRLHTATVAAAAGSADIVQRELSEALRLDPTLEGSADVKALQDWLRTPTAPR
jgi:uncharacterized protein (TIGR03790 family)